MLNLREALQSRPYPGRGVLLGRLSTGTPVGAYFLTGRSMSSRARRLVRHEASDIEIADTSGGPHDDLRHYLAVVERGPWLVFGNGDQVEPLATALAAGSSVTSAWAAHSYEPDPPIYTPRIWAAWNRHNSLPPLLGSARRSDRSDGAVDRVAWNCEITVAGDAVLLTTYNGTTTEVRTTREPLDVSSKAGSVEQLADDIWSALAPDLRVGAIAFELENVGGTVTMRCEVPLSPE